MTEKIRYSPEGWTFYGEDFGGKVEGLLAFKELNTPGLEVTPGIAIGASYFREFVRLNQFDENSWRDDILERGIIPDQLQETNQQILAKFVPGSCIAVRSSAIGEDGGVGIYSTFFMVTTNDPEADQEKLWSLQRQIYADYFSLQSREWLEANGLKFRDGGGVGLFIQPVVGDQVGGVFMPTISGVVTTINNELVIRLVLGLGTKAVDTKDAIVLKRENLNSTTAGNALFGLFETEGISASGGRLLMIETEYDWKKDMLEEVKKLTPLIDASKEFIRQNTPYYLEFAITPSKRYPQILQANPDKIRHVPNIELGPTTGRILCESNDIVNHGEVCGRGIVYPTLRGVSPDDLRVLEEFNKSNTGYLLIVDDLLLSRLSGRNGLQYSDFSNAAGVIEVQRIRPDTGNFLDIRINHTDRGGTHFAEICKRKDILFQGVTIPHWDKTLYNALGSPTDDLGQFGGFFDLEFKMVNLRDLGRTELFGETLLREYSRQQFGTWIDDLRSVAELLETIDQPSSDAFYIISGHMIHSRGRSVADFNPINFVNTLLPQTLVQINSALELVFSNLQYTDDYADYREGLKYGVTEEGGNVFELREYLLKLQSQVKKGLAML